MENLIQGFLITASDGGLELGVLGPSQLVQKLNFVRYPVTMHVHEECLWDSIWGPYFEVQPPIFLDILPWNDCRFWNRSFGSGDEALLFERKVGNDLVFEVEAADGQVGHD